MKSFFLLLCCGLFMSMMSCNNKNEPITTEASLRFTGLLAADGCGFFLDIDGQEYKPVNEEVIPETFQDENAHPVQLTYEKLEEPVEYSCGMKPSIYNSTIRIIEIKPL